MVCPAFGAENIRRRSRDRGAVMDPARTFGPIAVRLYTDRPSPLRCLVSIAVFVVILCLDRCEYDALLDCRAADGRCESCMAFTAIPTCRSRSHSWPDTADYRRCKPVEPFRGSIAAR